MIYHSILNNAQYGGYDYQCLKDKIVNQKRIDKWHLLVYWELNEQNDIELLKRVLGNPNKLIKGEYYESNN